MRPRSQTRGRREATERLSDYDQLRSVADRLEQGFRVFREPGRIVVAGKVGRDGVVASFPQLGLY